MENKKSIKLGSKGHYNLTVLNSEGSRVEEKCTGEISNVITNTGAFNSFFGGQMFNRGVAVLGTGSVEITETDTGLTNQDGGASANSDLPSRSGNEVDNLDGTATLTITREMTFTLGSKVGTFSEVGISVSGFIAGQLIKDEFGDPTTITILSDEQLIVTYTLEWTYPNVSTLVGTGTVTDSASNSYGYEVWVQPYFSVYTLNASRTSNNVYSGGDVGMWKADGTTSAKSDSFHGGGNSSGVQDATAKTLTFTSNFYQLSPSDGTITDAIFISCWSGDYAFSARIADTATALVDPMVNVNGRGGASVVLKFDTAINKTTDDTFSFQFDYTWSY